MSITNDAFSVNPHLELESHDEGVELVNRTQNVRKVCGTFLADLFHRLQEKNTFTLHELVSDFNLSDQVLKHLLDYSYVIPIKNLETFAKGVQYYPKSVRNERQASLGGLLIDPEPRFVVVGMPFDLAKGAQLSTVNAPCEIRKRINDSDLPYVDVGNISHFPHSESLETVGVRLNFLSDVIEAKGHFPIFLGGDHSISQYTVNGMLRGRKEIGIIHFDAHHDLYYDEDSLNHLNHANVFMHLVQQENVASILQIGVRTPPAKFSSAKILTLGPESSTVDNLSTVFTRLRKDIDYFVSFDVDVLDPTIAPEVVAPMPGGLSLEVAKEALSLVFENLNVVGIDIVEACASTEKTNKALDAAAQVLTHCIGSKRKRGF